VGERERGDMREIRKRESGEKNKKDRMVAKRY